MNTSDFPLHDAAERGRHIELTRLLEAGENPREKDNEGDEPIHFAQWNKHPKVIEALLAAGADINAGDATGNTLAHIDPWQNRKHLACDNRSFELPFLLARGWDINRRNLHGDTPAHLASHSDGLARYLLALMKAGADLSVPNHRGRVVAASYIAPRVLDPDDPEAPHVAETYDRLHEAILQGDCTPGWNAAHRAAIAGDANAIALLVIAGEDLLARDSHGRTPLHLAVSSGSADAVEALLHAGATSVIHVADGQGHTPLHLAAFDPKPTENEWDFSCESRLLSLLLAAGANPRARDHRGDTPAHILIHHAHADHRLLALLLAAGADINASGHEGNSLAHAYPDPRYTHPREPSDFVRFLVRHGINLKLRNDNGKTPVKTAKGDYRKALLAADPLADLKAPVRERTGDPTERKIQKIRKRLGYPIRKGR